jgi:ferredoxin
MLRCDAHGYCAELLPEVVELDEWGYPMITGDIAPTDLAAARRAAAACPKLALRLEATDHGARASRVSRRSRMESRSVVSG